MSDHTNSRPVVGDQFPMGGGETTWQRTEPLITPEEVKSIHLWGVSLVSGMIDPTTNKRDVMTMPMLARFIERAVAQVELETGLTIFPTEYEVRLPFDRAEFQSNGYMRLPQRPIASVESLSIAPSNDTDIFIVPPAWVEMGQALSGQINLSILTNATVSGGTFVDSISSSQTASGILLAYALTSFQWVSSFWRVRYTAGYKNGLLPKVLNDLIGTVAAMDILSSLASTFAKSQGQSLSIDSLSQSTSGGGPDIFTPRLKDLAIKRAGLVKKLKAMAGLTLFSSNV